MLATLFAFTGTGMAATTALAACDASSTWHNEYSCDGNLKTSGSCSASDASNPGDGKVFSGWNCSYSHDGSYADTNCYHFYRCTSKWTTPTTPTYYYARLYFDANGGKNAPSGLSYSSTSSYGSHTFTIPATKPTRDGYTFKGWDTNRAATTASIQPGATVTVSYGSSKTLYAVWQETPKDTTKPTITGVEDKTITVGDAFDPKAGVTANDDTDGDVTSSIKVTGNVDTSKPGTYELTYTVSDAAGNETSVKRTVTVRPVMNASMPETGVASASLVLMGVGLPAMLAAGFAVESKREGE